MTTGQNAKSLARSALWIDLARAMRPNQWTKNAVVLAALLFAYWDRSRDIPLPAASILVSLAAAIAFCMVSSGIYILNDIRDVEADRQHPKKRFRPIAAGRVSMRTAWIMASALLITGFAAAWLLTPAYAVVVGGYVLLQVAYSFGLKHISLLDVFMIAAGFVLRAMGGAVVLAVDISPWLLLCAFLLALFLALCKRRHEKIQVEESPSTTQRLSLQKYNRHLLDQLISIVSASTIVSYAMYTLSPVTVAKFETTKLGLTIPFVIFGIFRYLDLAYSHEKGDRPEKILLTDVPILVNIMAYCMVVVLIFLLQS
jgi:4-hydroxybenzoate polyprenyltransferase